MHGFFLLYVALASVAQSLIGFAFDLILLARVATLQVLPLTEVAVVISRLTLGNALGTLGGPKPELDASKRVKSTGLQHASDRQLPDPGDGDGEQQTAVTRRADSARMLS